MQRNFIKKNKGFTLVEIMVAVSIFAIVMMISIGAVLAIVGANKKAQSLNSVIDNLNFAFEGMVRDLRTGYDYKCNGEIPGDCLSGTGGTSVEFTSQQADGATVTYALDPDRHAITKTVGGITSDLTAAEVYIQSLNFYVADTDSTADGNYRQPRILVIIKGYAGNATKDQNGDVTVQNLSNFSLQTLVSQRRLDI